MKRLILHSVLLCSVLLLWTTSYADVPLSVPFKSQVPPGAWKNTLNCGQTSALMVFSYYNNTTPTEQNIREIDDWLNERFGDSTNNYNGSVTSTSKLVTLATEFGQFTDSEHHENWTLQDLRNELANGFPVIVAVRTNMSASGVGHFMVLTGIDDTFVYVNDPGKTLGANNRYSISQFESVWATQRYSVTTIHPNETQTNVVRANATLNGQPFSGSVNYNIVGPNGVIIGLAVPGETSNLPAGQYTFIYQNGGPPNSVFISVTPSNTQTLDVGGAITFTMNFSSQSYQWLSFVEGNPGIPGDGIFTNAAGGNNSFDFDLNPSIPMSQFPDGYTLTVFPPASQTFNNPQFTINTPNRPPPCTVSFGSGIPAPSGTVTVNGVLGFYSIVQQFHIQGNVDFANQIRPGCNFVLNDLYMSRLGLNRIGVPTNVTTIDAVTIGAGPNNTP